MLKYIMNLFGVGDKEEFEETQEEALPTLYVNTCEEKEASNESTPHHGFEEYSSYRKTGVITAALNNQYTIDDIYEFESTVPNLVVGAKVSFIMSISEGKLQVSDINVRDNWDAPPPLEEPSPYCRRNFVCMVSARRGREVFLIPGDLVIDLNSIMSDFVPIVGDWVNVDANVMIDENITDQFGQIYEVKGIKPLRPKIIEGRIKTWFEKTKTGIINGTVFFRKDALTAGYLPIVGDKILSEIIESDQPYDCNHRSLLIIPQKQHHSKLSFARHTLEEFEDENANVSVGDNVFIKAKRFSEEFLFKIQITNVSSVELVLVSVKLRSNSLQCRVLSRAATTLVKLKPKMQLDVKFVCTVKSMGTTKELLLFDFGEFTIGRWVTVSFESDHVPESGHFAVAMPRLGKIQFRQGKNELIKGERVTNLPRFVHSRLHEYTIPDNLLSLTGKYENDVECLGLIDELRIVKPGLSAPFKFDNYEDRFHTLLFLDEIHQLMAAECYSRERATFGKSGPFLTLEIENLAERRPSLMVGDRIMGKYADVSNPVVYEGYIHKIGLKQVYLKFSPILHKRYDKEEMTVWAVLSRSAHRRMHQAVGLVVANFNRWFVAPLQVKPKSPQIQFTYEPYRNDVEETRPPGSVHRSPQSSMGIIAKKLSERAAARAAAAAAAAAAASSAEGVTDKRGKAEKQIAIRKETDDRQQSGPSSPNTVGSKLLLDPRHSLKYYHKKPLSRKPRHTYYGTQKLEWYNKNLNYYQKEAVRNILLGVARPLPYFIFGPPGTGKTVTLVETILQILTLSSHSRLLVATPSNSAADLLALRLIDTGVLKPGDLIRLAAFRCINDNLLPQRLVPYSATVDIAKGNTRCQKFNVTKEGLTLGCNSHVIGQHRITIGTCTALGILYSMSFQKGHFTHVIVDEAGQATEPEIMIPLTFLDLETGQAILAGDPMQLGPVVLSKAAVAYGLDETYLDRMLAGFLYTRDSTGFPNTGGYDPRLVTRLVYNYRSLPGTLKLYNDLFYNGELISMISPTNSKEAKILEKTVDVFPCGKGWRSPNIVFHGVTGQNYQTSDSPSWCNPNEANQVLFYVKDLYRVGLTSGDIGIISPYLKQVREVRSLLKQMDYDIPKVGTVEEFQGQEFNVIIITTVRSSENFDECDNRHKIGFVCNPRRLNVAISRARSLVIIVGNPYLLSRDSYWRNVIKYCVENNAYCGCDLSAKR